MIRLVGNIHLNFFFIIFRGGFLLGFLYRGGFFTTLLGFLYIYRGGFFTTLLGFLYRGGFFITMLGVFILLQPSAAKQ